MLKAQDLRESFMVAFKQLKRPQSLPGYIDRSASAHAGFRAVGMEFKDTVPRGQHCCGQRWRTLQLRGHVPHWQRRG